ncbi:MAG: MltA domain-containing protein [Burkholderiaceae bacterium]|nr:MltA domain-containing protein [Burkholderiaceae bacterium]
MGESAAPAPPAPAVPRAPGASIPAPGEPQLPPIESDSLEGLGAALAAQCALARPPAPWPELCIEWRSQKGALLPWLTRRFEPQPLRGPDGGERGLITGYYEPELTGSRLRESTGQVPLLPRPPIDAPRARMPRAQIEAQAAGDAQALAWIDDPVEAYFLQVQGSGRVRLRDGSVMRVGYAGDNGHPYRAIGRDLIERGALTSASLSARAIADWLRANPVEGRELMHSNPRYVFFREVDAPSTGAGVGGRAEVAGASGPIGSLGVPLTALRSVAVDPRVVPLGSLLWLEVADPRGGMLRRLVLAQDTGAAIVGSPRADLFWGTGALAGDSAGLMKSTGRLWWLRPRP